MDWKSFKDEKPQKDGRYLWAENNWDAVNTKGDHLLRKRVCEAHWKGERFYRGTHTLINPDHWAEITYPEDAPNPY